MKIYLAGPEVFLTEAHAVGEAKKAICERHGAVGLFPLDSEIEPREPRDDWALAIFEGNLGLMHRADAVIANLTPFRSVSMDVGTAFEMGYMAARGRPVLGYTNVAGSYLERARSAGLTREGEARDPLGMVVEDFGWVDNLMMIGTIQLSGFEVLVRTGGRMDDPDLFTDLALFERCVEQLTRPPDA